MAFEVVLWPRHTVQQHAPACAGHADGHTSLAQMLLVTSEKRHIGTHSYRCQRVWKVLSCEYFGREKERFFSVHDLEEAKVNTLKDEIFPVSSIPCSYVCIAFREKEFGFSIIHA